MSVSDDHNVFSNAMVYPFLISDNCIIDFIEVPNPRAKTNPLPLSDLATAQDCQYPVNHTVESFSSDEAGRQAASLSASSVAAIAYCANKAIWRSSCNLH